MIKTKSVGVTLIQESQMINKMIRKKTTLVTVAVEMVAMVTNLNRPQKDKLFTAKDTSPLRKCFISFSLYA